MKRSLVFWMWNDRIEPEEVRRQIEEFHRKHVDGFFIHAMPEEFRPNDFPGGMPGYLSEHFFSMIGLAAECAAALDMELWLYDEGGWPSGTLNGRLTVEHPDLCMHHILPSGEIIAVPSRPDLLNREVTQLFIQATHEQYAKRLKPFFGKVIPGIFTDEPDFGVFDPQKSLPWSPVLAARFQERKGYEAKDAAMRIFRNGDQQARIDYCEVWCSLMADGYMHPLQEWCHANGLLFTGHFNGDDSVCNVKRLLGSDIFNVHQYFDMPGCDAIWRQIHPLMPESDLTRLTTSAAQGRRTISETFAVYGADLSLAEMKQVAAMQFVSGIGIVAPMAIHYSNCGGRQVTTCSNFFGADPRWENYAQFSDFLRRISKVSDRTTPIIKASVPFPVQELRAGNADTDIFSQGLTLARKQVTYDYAPDAPPVAGEPTPDLALSAPCLALRTRHLKSPRGERRILVNSGTAPLSCQFAAPAGFNVWFDPATGRRTPAIADRDGLLTLELPFGGAMVLLTLPGRAQKKASSPSVAAVSREISFRQDGLVRAFRAGENGLTEVFPVPATLPEDMCGTIRWNAEIDVVAVESVMLKLPQARRMICRLILNGKVIGTRLWGPYQWEFELTPGRNRLAVEVTGTPAAAMHAASHLQWLEARGFLNVYLQKCLKFEAPFADEKPLDGACLLSIGPQN